MGRKGATDTPESCVSSVACPFARNNPDGRSGIRSGINQNKVPFSVPFAIRYPLLQQLVHRSAFEQPSKTSVNCLAPFHPAGDEKPAVIRAVFLCVSCQ